jgi:hypothetical protein
MDVSTGQPLSALVANNGTLSANGGRVQITAAAAKYVVDSVINNKGVIEANAVAQRGGTIVLGAATAKSKPAGAPAQNVKLAGTISATGKKARQTGGTVAVTGENISMTGAKVDASGQAGGGTVSIGGKGSTATATTVVADTATAINASAIQNGDGGNVVVWSDQLTTMAGSIKATGGTLGGNGGFIETSGGTVDFTGIHVDTSAPFGKTGMWLVDPTDLSVDAAAAAMIVSALGHSNVTLRTNAGGSTSGFGNKSSGAGDIVVNAGISWSSGNGLTLSAYRDVTVNASIANTGGANITLHADNNGIGQGTVTFGEGGNVSTGGQVAIFYNPVGNDNTTINATSYTKPTDYSGNVTAGTLNAYMLVNTVFDLQNMQNNLSGTYALGRNIDASATAGWNGGAGFAPIGTSDTGFSGTLDGQAKTIDGLAIASAASLLGLFGYIDANGSVSNLNLTNVNINGTGGGGLPQIGAFAGLSNGTITNVSVSGTVAGTGSSDITGDIMTGGVVGFNGGSIANSSAAATVNVSGGAGFIGGLVGVSSGTISNSNATGSVNFTSSNGSVAAGGLVGSAVGLPSSGTSISNSFASGSVNVSISGNAGYYAVYAGGLVGSFGGTVGGNSIVNSYAFGNTSVTGSVAVGSSGYLSVQAGGLVGVSYGAITNSHAIGTVTSTAAATGCQTGAGNFCQSTQAGGLVGGNFGGSIANTYAIGAVTVGPYATAGGLVGRNASISGQDVSTVVGSITNSYAVGNVSSAGVNVALGGLVGQNDPLSTITNSQAYGAVLATAAVTKSHGDCSTTTCEYVTAGGLVGQNSGTISGTQWETKPDACGSGFTCATGNVTVGSEGTGGGLIGNNTGIVNNAFAINNVTGAAGQPGTTGHQFDNQTNLGGFVGSNAGTISNAFAIGSVGTAGVQFLQAGGFAGDNSGTISNSFAKVTVVAGDNSVAGGFSGSNSPSNCNGCGLGDGLNNAATIQNSTAYGDVTVGMGSVGGGFGAYGNGTFSNVTATGAVNSLGNSTVGGLVGALDVGGQISGGTANNTLVASTGPNSTVGGLVGVNGGTVMNSTSTAPVQGGPNSFIGGLIGANFGTVTSSQVDPHITGTGGNDIIGGLAGLNVGTLGGNTGALGNTAQVDITSDGTGNLVGGVAGVNGTYSFTGANPFTPGSTTLTGTFQNSFASGLHRAGRNPDAKLATAVLPELGAEL